MKISAIAAVAKNNVIGKDNKMPWHLPADLAYFKRTTLNHCIIMGRSTYEGFGRALPKRTNIVITRDHLFKQDNVLVAHSVKEALSIAEKMGEQETFIIGGAQIFEQTVNLWHKLYLTVIDLEAEGDAFFPDIDFGQWKLTSCEKHEPEGNNLMHYTYFIYERKFLPMPKVFSAQRNIPKYQSASTLYFCQSVS